MDEARFIKETLEKETGLVFATSSSMDALQTALAEHINDLIINNFEKLLYLLYRIDINEKSIKYLLKKPAQNTAGETIGKAIIDRQMEKIGLRKHHTPPTDIASEEEKW